MITIGLVLLKKEDQNFIFEALNKIESVEVSVLSIDQLSEDYEIFITQPDIEIVQLLYDRCKKPHIFILNGHTIEYHILKELVNLGISGLIENKDLSPLIQLSKLMSRAKINYNRLYKKVEALNQFVPVVVAV